MTRYRGRGVVRVVLLRGLRVLRRHHFSLLSALVLAGALAFAVTNTAFEDRSEESIAAEAPAGTPEVAALATATLIPSEQQDRIIYYLVDSVEEINLLRSTLRSDALYILEHGLDTVPRPFVYFLLVESPEDYAEGSHYLTQVTDAAAREGFSLTVVDLTR